MLNERRGTKMTLSDEQIKELLKWFATSSETRKKWSGERKKAYQKNKEWIQFEVIQKLPEEELSEKFREYYKSGGGNKQNLIQINRERIIANKSRFKEVILYLLNEKIELKERIDEIMDGKFKIEGFAQAILTSLLMDANIEKYCIWNNKTEEGLDVLGWKVYDNKDSWGEAYEKVLDALKKLKTLVTELNLTLDDVDLFLHTIAAESEGEKIIAKLRGENIVLTESTFNSVNLLEKKKQIILYGPPGTGKTFNTRELSIKIIESN